jgi:hypothetical protein
MRIFVFIFFIFLISSSCRKEKPHTISSTDFTVNKELIYLSESIELRAVDTTGNNYTYDFGDGNQIVGGYKAVHRYEKGGTFTITLTSDGKSTKKTVKVRPGYLSYQIKNKATRELNILSYIDNYQSGTVYRKDYYPGYVGDTLYTSYGPYGVGANMLHLFGASIFIGNTEYQLYSDHLIWFDERKHTVYEITDSSLVSPRVIYGGNSRPVYYIKDL